jgi:hypothetical protein
MINAVESAQSKTKNMRIPDNVKDDVVKAVQGVMSSHDAQKWLTELETGYRDLDARKGSPATEMAARDELAQALQKAIGGDINTHLSHDATYGSPTSPGNTPVNATPVKGQRR